MSTGTAARAAELVEAAAGGLSGREDEEDAMRFEESLRGFADRLRERPAARVEIVMSIIWRDAEPGG